MKVLITGVAGFVGSSLAERLVAEGNQVVGIDCFTPYYERSLKDRNLLQLREHKHFSFVEGDLCELSLASVLEDVEVVFHQAAQAGVRASWGSYFSTYTRCNVDATQCVLEACKGSASVRKVVYASSSSVYGDAEKFPTSETLLPKPVSPYGVTKLAAEHLMGLYTSQCGVNTASLRYFTVFGPRQRPDMAFHKFCKAALQKQEITIFGDGTQSRDFTYISDIVHANILAATKGSRAGVYNIGGGAVTTVNEVLAILREQVGSLKVRYIEKQIGEAAHTSADTTLAQRELGYSPQVTIKEGVLRELAWMEELLSTTP